ncbi:MAG: hypothetical protein WDM79_01135 [Terricaulis sp.]
MPSTSRRAVNRISIGAQALDDDALKALGRYHDSATSIRAIEAAANTGARVSLDLIYAREGQDVEAWSRELRAALALPVEHVSLYQLTIEPSTAFARAVARGSLTPPDAEAAADLYEATQEVCDGAGFPAYEISNHARSPEARARHNLVYWRSGDWLGIGPRRAWPHHAGRRAHRDRSCAPSHRLHRSGARARYRLGERNTAHSKRNRR